MKKFLILALSAALLTAFFGCGSPKEPEKEKPPEGTVITEFDLPTPANETTANTGEASSKMYKFTGESFTAIKDASPGSYLEITYTSTVAYAVGEMGWKSITDAGPVISGNGTGKKQEVKVYVEDLVLGDADFTLHMFNPSELKGVSLYAVPESVGPEKNPNATAGATKIVLPLGHKIPGRGDLSKADFKKITTATSGTLVFYWDDKTNTETGILKFGPKQGDPYKHYGISKETGTITEGNDGWRPVDSAEAKTVTYTVTEIKTSVGAAGNSFNKLEINNDTEGNKEGVLLYIELKP